MKTKFIPVVGRNKVYDFVKQAIRDCSPIWFVSNFHFIMRPYIYFNTKRERRRNIFKKLPKDSASQFYQLYKNARERWDNHLLEPLGNIVVTIPGTEHKVSLRTGTCDIILYYDIFLKEGYGKIKLENVETIIDCGANIGLASVFFLIQYPDAKVIALEPDPVNFGICQNNLKQFGSRAVVLNSALWHENCAVKINPTNRGTWASTVAPATEKADKTSIRAFDMQTIMQKHNLKEIDMLKIDIEGAEEAVFSSCNLGWLDKVKCLQIECENIQTKDVFVNAVSPRGFELSRFSEIMIAVNKNFKKDWIWKKKL